MNNDINNYISTVIKKRKEVYFLVTEKDLNSLRNSSIIGDVSIIIASIVLSGYFIDKNSYALLAGIVFIIVAVGFYFFVFSQVKELKSSGEVQSVNINAENDKNDQIHVKNNVPNSNKDNKKLVIIGARYYTAERTKNITQEIEDMVKNDKLTTIASNDIYGDPHPGEPKKLFILYKYNGVEISKNYNEGEKIELP